MVLGAHRLGPSNRLSIEIKGLEAGQLSPLDSQRNSSEITDSFHKSCVGEGGGGKNRIKSTCGNGPFTLPYIGIFFSDKV